MTMYQSLGCLGLLLLAVAGDSCPDRKIEDVLDVAIIGGGPGGTYSAYKLRKAGLSVGLFEYSDRIGGRLFTHNMAGSTHKVELGGMRFIDNAHTRLQNVVSELNLTPIIFKEGFGRSGRTRLFLRKESLTVAETKNGEVPYNLNPEEKEHQDNLWEYYLEKLTGLQLNGGVLTREASMSLRVVNDGRFLWELSFDEAIDKVASPEGKAFLEATHVFHSEIDPRASAVVSFDDHLGEDGYGGDVYTVDEGMSAIPNGLLQKFLDASTSHSVYKHHQLKSIKPTSRRSEDQCGKYTLNFQKTVTLQGKTDSLHNEEANFGARKVILAIPREALLEVDWKTLRERSVKNTYNAVFPSPASKVFLTFDETWWLNQTTTQYNTWVTKSDEMFSQAYDWWTGDEPGPYTLLGSYGDMESSTDEYRLNQRRPDMEGSEEGAGHVSAALRDEILDELAEAYGIARTDIPEPLTGVSQFWYDYPFGCGWITWKKGNNFTRVMEKMQKPSADEDVFVVGSDFAWGMLPSWVEGALETVDDVMKNYFHAESAAAYAA